MTTVSPLCVRIEDGCCLERLARTRDFVTGKNDPKYRHVKFLARLIDEQGRTKSEQCVVVAHINDFKHGKKYSEVLIDANVTIDELRDGRPRIQHARNTRVDIKYRTDLGEGTFYIP